MSDHFEPAYRTLVVATKSAKRWFDLDAVREPYKGNHKMGEAIGGKGAEYGDDVRSAWTNRSDVFREDRAGAPPLDYWLLDTQAGVDRVLKSMLPERVCKICGEPSRRIVELAPGMGGYHQGNGGGSDTAGFGRTVRDSTTLGWTDCGHNDWRAGGVLDPFDLGSEVGSARYIIADVFEALESLPDNSVDLVFSSPPFLALRSYLPADHPNKAKEIGSEATPADFLDTLLDVVEACDRVLAPHGSLCFELGDTFAGSGGAGGDYNEGGLRDGQPKVDGAARRTRDHSLYVGSREETGGLHHGSGASYERPLGNGGYGWPLPKSLSGIPTLFAWSLAYGRNLLRPERTTPRWRIRNVVVWARPNPPVGALGDKFRPATSYLTVACKSDKRWFDLDAVREPASREGFTTRDPRMRGDVPQGEELKPERVAIGASAPPLDYWEIPTQPYPGAHYATFPDKLVVKPVKAMCPSKVCRVCGEPSRRITEPTAEYANRPNAGDFLGTEHDRGKGMAARTERRPGSDPSRNGVQNVTLGWTDCECACICDDASSFDVVAKCPVQHSLGFTSKWRNGVVLDPFAGSGTTLAVATGHGRDAIGIDLDSRNAELALERVGPLFLTIETLEESKPFAPPAEDVETEIV